MTRRTSRKPRPEITIVLLNYRRPGNIPVILDSIERQTIRPVVFLWNNGPDDIDTRRIDRYEKSAANKGCMARWRMARKADTPYVMSLDDDLCFARDNALADVIESLRATGNPGCIVGPVGCQLGNEPSYSERRDVYAGQIAGSLNGRNASANTFEAVDMIKGRCMAFRRDQLDNLELPDEREDDIYLGAALARGQRMFHRVPLRLRQALRQLPEHGTGNWKSPGHLHSRDRAAAQYFPAIREHPANSVKSGPWRPMRRGEKLGRDGDQWLIQLGAGKGVLLNSTAALIWEHCDGSRTEPDLLAELCHLHDAPAEVLRRDLHIALRELVDLGALVQDGP